MIPSDRTTSPLRSQPLSAQSTVVMAMVPTAAEALTAVSIHGARPERAQRTVSSARGAGGGARTTVSAEQPSVIAHAQASAAPPDRRQLENSGIPARARDSG